jgi:hypothetical protein
MFSSSDTDESGAPANIPLSAGVSVVAQAPTAITAAKKA